MWECKNLAMDVEYIPVLAQNINLDVKTAKGQQKIKSESD